MRAIFKQQQISSPAQITELLDLLRKSKVVRREHNARLRPDLGIYHREIRRAVPFQIVEIAFESVRGKRLGRRPAKIRRQQSSRMARHLKRLQGMINRVSCPKEEMRPILCITPFLRARSRGNRKIFPGQPLLARNQKRVQCGVHANRFASFRNVFTQE